MGNERPGPEQPPHLSGIDEQLARVARGITEEWAGQPLTIENRDGKYGHVEAFLEDNHPVFKVIDEMWDEVDSACQNFRTVVGSKTVEVWDQDEGGNSHPTMQEAAGIIGRSQRRSTQRRVSPQMLLAAYNNRASDEAQSYTHTSHFAQYARRRFTAKEFRSLLEEYSKTDAAIREETSIKIDRPSNKQGPAAELRKEAAREVEIAFVRAFIAQHFGFVKLQEVLADDNLVMPFLSRVEELVALSEQGEVEFPGFLETLQAHIIDSRQRKRQDLFHWAIHRVGSSLSSDASFVRDMLTEDIDTIREYVPNPSADFVAGVAAMQAVASIITFGEESGITQEEIIERVADQFSMLPLEWITAYEDSIDQRVAALWNQVQSSLRKFEHLGRIQSKVTFDELVRQTENPDRVPRATKKSASKHKNKSGNPATRGISNTSLAAATNVAARKEQLPPVNSFALLNEVIEGKDNDLYTVEHIEGMDNLMNSTMIVEFLQNKPPGMVETLRSCLEQLSAQPLRSSSVEVLMYEPSFRIAIGQRKLTNEYRLRLFKGQDTSSDIGRIHIRYGVCVLNGKRCLTLKRIGLAES